MPRHWGGKLRWLPDEPVLHLKHLGSHGASLSPRAAHRGQPIESKHRQAGKWFKIGQLLQSGASCREEVLNLPPSAGVQAAADGVAGVGDQSGISQQFTIRALQGEAKSLQILSH